MKSVAGAVVALGVSASVASAAQIRFDLLEATFFDAVGGNVLGSISDPFGTYSDPVAVYWGENGLTTSTASGYEFDARAVPFQESPDTAFALGDFTHFNNPIFSGTGIDSIKLSIKGALTLIAEDLTETDLGEKIFSFFVDHNETPNSADPCADGGANGDGVNSNGCADSVDISTLAGTESFNVDGKEITLKILGFSTSVENAANGIFDSTFWSAEGGTNTRVLAAEFSEVEVIPLPAAGWLLLGGIGGLAALRRKKST